MSKNNLVKFLKYKLLEDMLKIVLSYSQSALGVIPLIYHISNNNDHILMIYTGSLGSNTIHYFNHTEKSIKKFIQLNKQTGSYLFVDNIGNDPQSIYIPVLEVVETNIIFD